MKSLRELGTFNPQSYKGYLIKFSGIHNLYYVTKDGINIYSNPSLSDVRLNIDLIAD
jgi:hypothetical protein